MTRESGPVAPTRPFHRRVQAMPLSARRLRDTTHLWRESLGHLPDPRPKAVSDQGEEMAGRAPRPRRHVTAIRGKWFSLKESVSRRAVCSMRLNEPRTHEQPVTEAPPPAPGQRGRRHPRAPTRLPRGPPPSAGPTPFREGDVRGCAPRRKAPRPRRGPGGFRRPVLQGADHARHEEACSFLGRCVSQSQEMVTERPRWVPTGVPCCDGRGGAGARGPPRREPSGPMAPRFRLQVSPSRSGLSLPLHLRNSIPFSEADAGRPSRSSCCSWLIFGFWRPGSRARSGLWFHRASRPGGPRGQGCSPGWLWACRLRSAGAGREPPVCWRRAGRGGRGPFLA